MIGEPLPGAREALARLKARGAKIHIFSGRLDRLVWGKKEAKRQRILIRNWLREKQIPYDAIASCKPGRAWLLLDDRALQFNGSWTDAEREIEARWREFRRMCDGK